MDNSVIKPLTPDGMTGWDGYGQLWAYVVTKTGSRIGSLIGDPRGHKCRICNQGWVLTTESLLDQQWCRDYNEWRHLSCHVRFFGLQERDMWRDMLIQARLWPKEILEIPNEYWRNDPPYSDRPWYRIILKDTERTLKLGFRKRVYHMEIEPLEAKPLPVELAQRLLGQKTCTKEISASGMFIHAWSEAFALEYMKAFAKILQEQLHPVEGRA